MLHQGYQTTPTGLKHESVHAKTKQNKVADGLIDSRKPNCSIELEHIPHLISQLQLTIEQLEEQRDHLIRIFQLRVEVPSSKPHAIITVGE